MTFGIKNKTLFPLLLLLLVCSYTVSKSVHMRKTQSDLDAAMRTLRRLEDDDKKKEKAKEPQVDCASSVREIPDPGCTAAAPFRCQGFEATARVQCKKSYEACPASSGCSEPGKPLRCVTGECVDHIGKCPYDAQSMKSFAIECPKVEGQEFERCYDGICRPKGACKCIEYSGCKFGQVQCPNGSCAAVMSRCATIGLCPMDKPFNCGGGLCEKKMDDCGDRISSTAFDDKTIRYGGEPERLDHIHVVPVRNLLNFKSIITIRFMHRSFMPNEIGPNYDILPHNAPTITKGRRILAQKKLPKPHERKTRPHHKSPKANKRHRLQALTPQANTSPKKTLAQ